MPAPGGRPTPPWLGRYMLRSWAQGDCETNQEDAHYGQTRGSAAGLVDWSRRDPWRERMGELVEKHVRKACDLNDIDIFDLPDVVGRRR